MRLFTLSESFPCKACPEQKGQTFHFWVVEPLKCGRMQRVRIDSSIAHTITPTLVIIDD